MDFILKEIEKCLDSECYYAAVIIALTLPAICAAAEKTSGNTQKCDRIAYEDWIKKSGLVAKYGATFPQTLYNLRCSVLHQGKYDADKLDHRLLICFDNKVIIHNCTFDMNEEKAIVLDGKIFCRDMADAVTSWMNKSKDDPTITANMKNIVSLYEGGLTPFIKGVAVIG